MNRGERRLVPLTFSTTESADQPVFRSISAANCGNVDEEMRDADKSSREVSVQSTKNAVNSRESSVQFTGDQAVSATGPATFSAAEMATGAESSYCDLPNPDEFPELPKSSGFSESTRNSAPKTKVLVSGTRPKPASEKLTEKQPKRAVSPARNPIGATGTSSDLNLGHNGQQVGNNTTKRPKRASDPVRKPRRAPGTPKVRHPGRSGQISSYKIPEAPVGGGNTNTPSNNEGAVSPEPTKGQGRKIGDQKGNKPSGNCPPGQPWTFQIPCLHVLCNENIFSVSFHVNQVCLPSPYWVGREGGGYMRMGGGNDAPSQLTCTGWSYSPHIFLNPSGRLCPHWSMCFESSQRDRTLLGKVGGYLSRSNFQIPVWLD